MKRYINRLAKPLGILGSVWAILVSTFIFAITPGYVIVENITRDTQTGIDHVTASVREPISANLPLQVFTIVTLIMGIVSLITLLLISNPALKRILLWISFSGILIFGALSQGIIVVPAIILLVLTLIDLKNTETQNKISTVEKGKTSVQ